MKRLHFSINDFYCEKCGMKGIMLPRQNNRKRPVNHLKKLYCVHCKKETNHIEKRG